MVEGDCLAIVQALRDVCLAPSSVAPLVYGMIAATYGSQYVNFSHVQRQGNRPAHLLAKNVLGIEDKAKAFEEGIVFAGDVGIQNFVVKGDYLAIVQALLDVSPAPSSVTPLVYGMIATTYGSQCVNFSHLQRQSNRPAHLLAKNALSIDDYVAWIEESPYSLKQALFHGALSLSVYG